MKKYLLGLASVFLTTSLALAQGGMWPAFSLKDKEADMKSSGLLLSAEDIYSESKPSLKDAVVLFGGGCTGEIVSKNGLLFTNHHCGYSYAQSLSTVERNILLDGYWAKNLSEELPCPGLEVSFVRKSMDVTDVILSGVTDQMSFEERTQKIEKNTQNYITAYQKLNGATVIVKPYFDGNQYVAHEMETFSDVRLVGFPPNGIGKFGGDTDNWMWPRHTGDFAVFRVYADKDNKPAAYSESNVPYKPKKYLTISTAGVQEGDFSMVYGFPFRTMQFISSYQTETIQTIIDPIRVYARGARLAAMDKTMRKDKEVFLKYAAKQSSISNGWKKWTGEMRGLKLNDVIGKKQDLETRFQQIVDGAYPQYKDVLAEIQVLVSGYQGTIVTSEIIREMVMGIEIIQAASYLDKLMNIYRSDTLNAAGRQREIAKLDQAVERFYKNYDLVTDRNVFDTLMPIYFQTKELNTIPAQLEKIYYNNAANFKTWGDVLYSQSVLNSYDKVKALLRSGNAQDTMRIKKDPAYQIYRVVKTYMDEKINPALEEYHKKLEHLNRLFTAGQLATGVRGKKVYPDANQTLRLTYGPVKGIRPYGMDEYSYITTLDGVMQKTNPDVEEFNTPNKLIQLYLNKDYGRWSQDGTMPVCFVAQNHTSGGNSGSPVLNAKGELIGINFDRIWDGTMSDIYYDPNLCRNISVDIRYVMFIIEKVGEASWLFDEMTIK